MYIAKSCPLGWKVFCPRDKSYLLSTFVFWKLILSFSLFFINTLSASIQDDWALEGPVNAAFTFKRKTFIIKVTYTKT